MGASTRSLFTAEKIIYLLLTSNEMSLQTHAKLHCSNSKCVISRFKMCKNVLVMVVNCSTSQNYQEAQNCGTEGLL